MVALFQTQQSAIPPHKNVKIAQKKLAAFALKCTDK